MSEGATKILVVEDNALNLELATELLSAHGHTVVGARTAEEGLRLARTERPDLILLDVRLPGMDGLAAVRALKRDPETQAILTVAMTAQAMAGDEEAALAAGFDAYVTKPIDTRTFPGLVARLLSAGAGEGGS
jgi:two-component system cell cycle response regulator DivK